MSAQQCEPWRNSQTSGKKTNRFRNLVWTLWKMRNREQRMLHHESSAYQLTRATVMCSCQTVSRGQQQCSKKNVNERKTFFVRHRLGLMTLKRDQCKEGVQSWSQSQQRRRVVIYAVSRLVTDQNAVRSKQFFLYSKFFEEHFAASS